MKLNIIFLLLVFSEIQKMYVIYHQPSHLPPVATVFMPMLLIPATNLVVADGILSDT